MKSFSICPPVIDLVHVFRFVISFLFLFWNTKNLPHPVFSGNINHCCHGIASFHFSLTDNYNLFYENQNGHWGWNPSILWTVSTALMISYHTKDVSKKHLTRYSGNHSDPRERPLLMIYSLWLSVKDCGAKLGFLIQLSQPRLVWFLCSVSYTRHGECACMHVTVVLVEYHTVYKTELKKKTNNLCFWLTDLYGAVHSKPLIYFHVHWDSTQE